MSDGIVMRISQRKRAAQPPRKRSGVEAARGPIDDLMGGPGASKPTGFMVRQDEAPYYGGKTRRFTDI